MFSKKEKEEQSVQETDGKQDPNKFDLTVHHRDRLGRVLKVVPYRLHVYEGRRLFERPVGSGNVWYENNEPAGRMEFTILGTGQQKKKWNEAAKHELWVPPVSEDARVSEENAKLQKANEQLMQELENIRAERAGEPAKDVLSARKPEAQPQKAAPKAPKQKKAEAPVAGEAEAEAEPAEGGVKAKNHKDLL